MKFRPREVQVKGDGEEEEEGGSSMLARRTFGLSEFQAAEGCATVDVKL